MAAKKKEDGKAYQKLKKDLAEGTLGQLYLFYGEEAYLRDHYLSQMKKQLAGAMEAFNVHRFAGRNLTVHTLSQAVDSLPVQSARTLLVVDDYDLYKSGEREALMALLADLPDYCCLVFVYDTISYQPDARTKLHAVLREHGSAVEFAKQEQDDLVKWVRRRFAALDRDIAPKDAEYLIFLCGGLMTGLVSEIEKIGAYAKNRTVGRREIDAVADPVLDAVVFQMTDAVTRRDLEKAAAVLGDLLRMQQPAVMILAVLGKQMRQLYTARLALDEGKDAAYLKTVWGMHSAYPAQLLLTGARRFDAGWCRRAVRLCAEADLELKRSSTPEKALLATLLMRLAEVPGRKGAL